MRWVNRLCVKSWHQTPSELAKRDFESACIKSPKFSEGLIYHDQQSVGRLLKTGFLVCHTRIGGPRQPHRGRFGI